MKKKRKQHNPEKRAKRFFNNVRLWSWETMVDKEGLRISHGEARCGFVWKQLTEKEVRGLVTRNNNWSVCCRALCHVDNHYWIESEMRSARDIKINDFAFLYEGMRDQVLSQVKKAHIIDMGWIVQSYGKTDRIDSNFELAYQGEITQRRHDFWLELNKTYRERAAA